MAVQFKTIDDVDLPRLAAEPWRPLFGTSEHAVAMVPWVILLACLPTLYAVANRPLTDECTLWGLKALKMASATNVAQFVDPGSADVSVPFRWQPPLTSWLAALGVRGLGQWTDSAVFVTAYLATCALIVMVYLLAGRLEDAKLGLLTVVIFSFHGDVLAMSQSPSPVALGLCLAVTAIWAFLGHLHKSRTLLSANLLGSGIALGLCLLAAGPLALVVFITLLLYLLATYKASIAGVAVTFLTGKSHQTDQLTSDTSSGMKRRDRAESTISRGHGGGHLNSRSALLSLAVMALTAFAVGGWWELMMSYSYGTSFWQAWLTGRNPSISMASVVQAPISESSLTMSRGMGELLLVLAGPALYGFLQAIRQIRHPENSSAKHVSLLLILWAITAGVMWQLTRTYEMSATVGEEIYRGYLLLPLSILAAWGVLQIADGRASIVAVAIIALVTAANLIWNAQLDLGGTGFPKLFVLLVIIGGLAVMASLGTGPRTVSPRDRRGTRLLVRILFIVLAAGHCIWNVSTIHMTGDDDRELEAIRQVLSGIDRDVQDFTIISSDEKTVPPQLEFLARSLWPRAFGETVQSWATAAGARDLNSTPTDDPPTDPSTSEQQPAHVFLMWHASQSAYPVARRNLEIVRFDEYFRHRKLAILVLPATDF